MACVITIPDTPGFPAFTETGEYYVWMKIFFTAYSSSDPACKCSNPMKKATIEVAMRVIDNKEDTAARKFEVKYE